MPLALRHKVITQLSDATENFEQIAATAPRRGNGTPEGVIAGYPGDLYSRLDGGAGTSLYVKESGAGTKTGWIPK